MDSSSDGSFAWTDASDDTSDSENMSKNNKNTTQSGEESESGKSYKKQLQQQLFINGEKNDLSSNIDSKLTRKRKLSEVQSHSQNIKSPKKKKIKIEPESDVDVQKLKQKHKSEPNNEEDDESYDDDYLNSRVKDEENFVIPTATATPHKKKSKNVSDVNDTTLNNNNEKSNVNNSFDESNNGIFEESSLANETKSIDRSKMKNKKSKKNTTDLSERQSYENESSIEEDQRQPSYPSNDSAEVESMANGNASVDDISLINSSTVSVVDTKRKAKLSERFIFEDSDTEFHNKVTSKHIKKSSSIITSFEKLNSSLKPCVTRLPCSLDLTNNDEIWVIRCPKDIQLEAFQDKKINLDNKCKIKLGEQTYEGTVTNEVKNVTVVCPMPSASTEDNVALIKNVPLQGCVRLHRRLPKAHIQYDNVMANNYNFIPLPETKCRHPLFGNNYKKAIKLPSNIRERLKEEKNHSLTFKDKKKKKKHKTKLVKDEELLCTPKVEVTQESISDPIPKPKKKKKHKHKDTAYETDTSIKKKFKHNPESAEVWDSEKAIEENLFNF